MKQLQLAWSMYPDDNNDKLAPNKSVNSQNVEGSWVVGHAQKDTTTTNIQKGVLFPYTRSPAVYVCSSDKATVAGNKEVRQTRSYSAAGPNTPSELAGKLGWDWDKTLWLAKGRQDNYTGLLNLPPGPTKAFIFIDEHEQSIDDAAMIVDNPLSDTAHQWVNDWIDLPADRRRRRQACSRRSAREAAPRSTRKEVCDRRCRARRGRERRPAAGRRTPLGPSNGCWRPAAIPQDQSSPPDQ